MAENTSTILIVDDQPVNLKLLFTFLKEQNFHLLVADSGERALKALAKEKKPDLILLDVMMPGMDGFEVCRRLKSDPDTTHIPVIFVTGKDDAKDQQEGISLGAVGYLQKPINLKHVLELVEQHVADSSTT